MNAIVTKTTRRDPSVSVLEEISDQDLSAVTGGTNTSTIVTTLLCLGASYALGNHGYVCTATVECQSNCR